MTQEITPFIYNFSQRNVYKNLSHLTEEDTYSGPNWSSILTGVHYNKHNVTDNSFEGRLFNLFPTFINYIENNVNSLNTTSIVNWFPINQNKSWSAMPLATAFKVSLCSLDVCRKFS